MIRASSSVDVVSQCFIGMQGLCLKAEFAGVQVILWSHVCNSDNRCILSNCSWHKGAITGLIALYIIYKIQVVTFWQHTGLFPITGTSYLLSAQGFFSGG